MEELTFFWYEFLEILYTPFQYFNISSNFVSFIVILFFMATQFWLWYHLLIKPFIEIFKILLGFNRKNKAWTRGVEYGENKK